MVCPKCKCEIGNQTRCPYCGTVLQSADYTIPANQMQQTARDPESGYHLANVDTWNLIQVVLLSGIFLTNILELVLLLAN